MVERNQSLTEGKPTPTEIVEVGQGLVAIALERVREGNIQKRPIYPKAGSFF